MNIIHRDLKLENILIFEHTLKITDFGTAKMLNPIYDIEYSNKGSFNFSAKSISSLNKL